MALSGDIERALAEAFEERKQAGEFDSQLDDFMQNQVVPVWQDFYPVDTGEGRDSIRVTKAAQAGQGEVSATADEASYVEFATEDTQEYAPRLKTIEHFNGGQLP
jgi:hypothetical protein